MLLPTVTFATDLDLPTSLFRPIFLRRDSDVTGLFIQGSKVARWNWVSPWTGDIEIVAMDGDRPIRSRTLTQTESLSGFLMPDVEIRVRPDSAYMAKQYDPHFGMLVVDRLGHTFVAARSASDQTDDVQLVPLGRESFPNDLVGAFRSWSAWVNFGNQSVRLFDVQAASDR